MNVEKLSPDIRKDRIFRAFFEVVRLVSVFSAPIQTGLSALRKVTTF